MKRRSVAILLLIGGGAALIAYALRPQAPYLGAAAALFASSAVIARETCIRHR